MIFSILGSATKGVCIDNYEFFDSDVTWEQASGNCLKNGGFLVTMDTTTEWDTVKAAIAKKVDGDTKNHHWFIGLRRENGTWTWQEPANVTRSTVAANDPRWAYDEPSDDFDEPCGEIHSNYRGQQGHFNNVICNEKPDFSYPRGYICEPGKYLVF